MRSRVYYYPPASKGGYANPYSSNFKQALGKYFEVLDKENKPSVALGLSFFLNAFRADIYVINWLESVAFLSLGRLQYIFARLGLWIIKLRKKKIVWMFHNIHPHQGENILSRKIQAILFDSADLVISHSQEAASFAKDKAKGEVLYVCHPVKFLKIKPIDVTECSDVLIWGAIAPYKGVVEFLQEVQRRNIDLTVRIIGKCNDAVLADSIRKLCGKNVLFENRRASFEELAGLMQHTNYVLFPYTGGCVSSSGALIDTIVLGGYPIGPDKGAFKDLLHEGVCRVYQGYDELFSILGQTTSLDKTQREDFIKRNSWENFADFVYAKLKTIK